MKIVFYDSYCGLCHFAVGFLMKLDVSHQLKFAPIKGETFYQIVPERFHHVDSVFLYDGDKIFIKSDAIINCVILLKPNYILLKLLYLFPKFFRDYIYDLIARNRKRKSTCYIYPNGKDRFLP